MSSIIRRRSRLTVLVSLMGSSIRSEVQRHLDSQDGAPQCATAILSTDYRTLGSCPRAAGWSAATSCHGPVLPTSVASQVGSFLGYTDRAADVIATAAHDP